MAAKCKNLKTIMDSYLFHHGLVKLLVLHVLRKTWSSWDQLFRFEGFAGTNISQEENFAMPMHASSNHKSKKQVLDRTFKSSSTPTFPSRSGHVFKENPKFVGLDAPKEPIRHSVLETSSMRTHGS